MEDQSPPEERPVEIAANGAVPEQISTILESIGDGFVSLDRQWRFTYVNAQAEIFLGKKREELLGRQLQDEFPEALKLNFFEQFQKAVRQESPLAFGGYYPPLEKWFEVRATPHEGGLSIYFLDVSEHKRTEEALSWEANVNASLAELSKALLTPKTLEEISDLILEHARQLTGSRFGFVAYIDPRSGHMVAPTLTGEIWESCPIAGKTYIFEEFKGLWGWVLDNKKPLLTNSAETDPRSTGTPPGHLPIRRFLAVPAMDGETLGGIVALANPERDFTERDLALVDRLASTYSIALQNRRRKEALQESESKYRSLFEDSPASLWEEDFSAVKRYLDEKRRAGVTDFRAHFEEHPEEVTECSRRVKIVDVNKATLKMFRAGSKKELFGNLARILPEDSHDQFKEELVALASGATRFETEGVNRTLTGEEMIVNMRLTLPPGYEDCCSKVLISLIDMTERSREEEGLRKIDRIKNEFISTAAHELRTPLASVVGFAELLLNDHDFTAEEQKEFLTIIYEKGDALAAIVDDLLDLSRIESGRIVRLEKEPGDICALIRQVTAPHQKESGIHSFEMDLQAEPVELEIDRGKVGQVLENLLSNAIKYSPDGGRIRISGTREKELFRVSVADEGIGMTPEQVEKIFDKFYRADASTTAVGGLGLGMSIAKKIVEAHGGEIWVESEPDLGTTVHFALPGQVLS